MEDPALHKDTSYERYRTSSRIHYDEKPLDAEHRMSNHMSNTLSEAARSSIAKGDTIDSSPQDVPKLRVK